MRFSAPSSIALALLLWLTTQSASPQVGPRHFIADGEIAGNSLNGWRPMGAATWSVQDGEVTGRPTSPEGGWLFLDRPLQNVSFYAKFLSTGAVGVGVLLRAEKTADGGFKGTYLEFDEAGQRAFDIALNTQGRELSRKPLPAGEPHGGLPDLVANTPPEVAEAMKTKTRTDITMPKGIHLEGVAVSPGKFIPGSWNSLNVDLFQDALMPSVNGAPVWGSAFPQTIVDNPSAYGVIALYVAGTGEARFSGVAWRDLTRRTIEPETLSPNYEMRRLDSHFYSWAPAVADFDGDGTLDIAAGPYIYLGPDFRRVWEYYTPVGYNATAEYPEKSTIALAADFTGDGWPDIVQFTGSAGYISGILYVNPHGEARHWASYRVIDLLANEDTLLGDIDGDGVPEIIHGGPYYALGYTKPDPANPTGKRITKIIAEKGPWGNFTVHGLGIGDIDGDGRLDLLTPYGWWQQPAQNSSSKWVYHPVAFGRAGSSQGGPGGGELCVTDLNGDGLNDVITSLEGHGFGLAWYEQKRNAKSEISFVRHIIMDNFETSNAGGVTFTELHSLACADMDGDGIPDIVTGKRAMSHLLTWYDPDPYGAPVLYVYHTVRDKSAPGGVRFVPELVHNASGVGSALSLVDINHDGRTDIVTTNALGTFLFLNHTKKKTAPLSKK